MTLSRILLLPFSLLYGLATGLRNYLYNVGYSKSFNYDIMVINVGNLRVGGTGKTPMIEYLVRLLHQKYSLATLSRGYKRKSKGFILASAQSTSDQLGDEPYQMFLKYGKVTQVAVGEERSLAIPHILMEHPETQVILMDDAFQHREVRPDFNILLSDYNDPFFEDSILPGGRLRESRSGAKRADVIVMTKCPSDISAQQMSQVADKVGKYSAPGTPVFFTALRYSKIRALNGSPKAGGSYVAFSGLANPGPFEQHLKENYNIVDTVTFNDHHHYTVEEFKSLVNKAREQKADLLTTEKDVVKFRSPEFLKHLKEIRLCYISIEHKFLKDGSIFDASIIQAIDNKYNLENQEERQAEE